MAEIDEKRRKMGGFNILFVWVLALPLLSSSLGWCPVILVSGYGEIFIHPKEVTVQNNLSPETPMTLHCKSKDDDLAVHVLDYNQYFQWHFNVNFAQTTRFWCYMLWYDEFMRPVEATFDIYTVKRDYPRCDGYCYWSIRKDGVYSSPTSIIGPDWELMFKWPYT